WNDREKTAAAFIRDARGPDPDRRLYKTGDLAKRGPDGLVYFLGRSDSQIKSRGYRIELGEIEAALNTVDGLRESAVVAIPTTAFQGKAICCAFVPAAAGEATPASLRSYLGRRIPSYMLPHHWLALESLPRNGNGKIDRPRLIGEFERRRRREIDGQYSKR